MTKYLSLIKNILSLNRAFKKLEEKKDKNLLMGPYGELLVLNQLEFRKIDVKHKGGQSPYDILIEKPRKIKLEIKTSVSKKERFSVGKEIKSWGWKVQARDKKGNLKPIRYDWIILVKLSENWKENEFYALPKKLVEEMSEFSWAGHEVVGKAVYLFPSKSMFKKAVNEKNARLINDFSKEFNKNPKKYKLSWKKILKCHH